MSKAIFLGDSLYPLLGCEKFYVAHTYILISRTTPLRRFQQSNFCQMIQITSLLILTNQIF